LIIAAAAATVIAGVVLFYGASKRSYRVRLADKLDSLAAIWPPTKYRVPAP
jgi:hypothetical protein